MKREFLINLIFLVLINVVIKPIYLFGIDRGIQNTVGEVYGIYFSLLSFTYLFQVINDLGLQNYTARQISMQPEQVNQYLSATLQLKIYLGLLFSFLVGVFGWILGYNSYYFSLLGWLVGIQILTSALLYLRANIAGLGYYRIDSFLSILDKTILIAVVGYMLWSPSIRVNFKIEWFLYAQFGSILISFVFAYTFIRMKQNIQWAIHRIGYLLNIAKSSYPYAIIYILSMIYTRIDAVMLERMTVEGIRESFMYASAYRLLDAANMFSYLFIGLLLPMFSRLIKIGEGVDALFDVAFRLMVIVVSCISVPIWFYNVFIMDMLYLLDSVYGGALLSLLMVGYIFMAIAQILGALMLASGAVRKINALFVFGILINVILNIFLIPKFQAIGAAATTLATEFFILLGFIVLSVKEHRTIWNPRTVLKALLYLPICCLGTFTLSKTLSHLPNHYLFVLSVLLCFILAFILRIIPVKSTLKVLLSNKIYHNSHSSE